MMTEREFLTAVLANASITEEVKAYAEEGIAKLDARNEKRKNTETKVQKENREKKGEILRLLAGTEGKVASEIAEALGISTQKASALCGQLAKDELLLVGEVKVKSKGAVKFYSPIVPTKAEEVEGE